MNANKFSLFFLNGANLGHGDKNINKILFNSETIFLIKNLTIEKDMDLFIYQIYKMKNFKCISVTCSNISFFYKTFLIGVVENKMFYGQITVCLD
jgi:hypothetical protein